MNTRKFLAVFALFAAFLLAGCMHNTDTTPDDTNDFSTEPLPNPSDDNMEDDEMTDDEGDDVMDDEMTEDETDEDDDTPADDGDVTNYTMELFSFGFAPNVIEAVPGETIRITLQNTGGFHDFVLDEFGVRSPQINTGEEAVVEFTVPEDASGDYEFYCSVGNHRERGMIGTLTVN